jgi:hypothetical protein
VGDDAVENDYARGLLRQLYLEAQQGLRRVVAFGLYCYEIKERLKHGQFGPWLKENCPDISWRAARRYMELSRGVLEVAGLSINDFGKTATCGQFAHRGEFLLLPDAKIPESLRPVREKICRLIDGKSARQLFFEFKTADDLDGEVIVRRPGIGDGAWEKWMWEFHVELIKDGVVPPRQHVKKSIRKEFDQYQSSKRIAKLPSAEEVAQGRRQELSRRIDLLIADMKVLIGEGDSRPLAEADRAQLVVLDGWRVKLGEAIKLAMRARKGS